MLAYRSTVIAVGGCTFRKHSRRSTAKPLHIWFFFAALTVGNA